MEGMFLRNEHDASRHVPKQLASDSKGMQVNQKYSRYGRAISKLYSLLDGLALTTPVEAILAEKLYPLALFYQKEAAETAPLTEQLQGMDL